MRSHGRDRCANFRTDISVFCRNEEEGRGNEKEERERERESEKEARGPKQSAARGRTLEVRENFLRLGDISGVRNNREAYIK